MFVCAKLLKINNMKSILIIIFSSFSVILLGTESNESAGFEILCVESSTNDIDATIKVDEKTKLSKPLVTDSELIGFNPQTFELKIATEARKRFAGYKSSTFVIRFNNVVVFSGKIVSSNSSAARTCPVIIIEEVSSFSEFKVHSGYPPRSVPSLRDNNNASSLN